MAWYYRGMGFNKEAADKGALRIRTKYKCKTKVIKSKDPFGGFLYKVYADKKGARVVTLAESKRR